jgi:serralysin
MPDEQIFTWEGISLPSYWGGNWGSATADIAFNQIQATGASSVAIIPAFYMPNKTANTMGLVANQSETIAQTRAAMLDVTSRGMNVMLKPHVESLDFTWRAEIAPTDVNLWFQNYKKMMLEYAKLAQETGAPMLCIGTELKSLSGAAYRDKWVDLIAAIRDVYDGLVTYAATYDEAKHVSFWDKVDYIGVDAYVPLTYSNAPTVDEMVRAWTETPASDWVRQIYDGKSVIEYYKALSEQYGKKMIFTEVGYRSLDGTNKDPGAWSNGGTVDQQEQRDAYEALFKVMTTYGGQWLDGAFLWSYHPFENPESAGIQPTDYTTQGKLANATITAAYSSPAHVTGLTRNGTASADKLDGGYHNDVLNGAGGADVLWGGAGQDQLDGGEGNDTLTGDRGDDRLIGGGGDDKAIYSGARADYDIDENPDGTMTVADSRTGKDGTDILADIRFAKFSDGTLDLSTMEFVPNPVPVPPSTPSPSPVPSPASITGTPGPDQLVGKAGADLIIGLAGNDALYGRDGDDVMFGDYGADRLYGEGGNDVHFGGYGNDTLTGGNGNDRLWGEFGRDSLSGGLGRDIFAFDTKPRKTEIDKILDFSVRDDTIWLDHAVFRKLGKGSEASPGRISKTFFTTGAHARDKNDYLVYDPDKKTLFYDADGSSHGAAIAIATFSLKQKLSVADLLVI